MTCRAIVCMLLALLLIFAGGPFSVCQAQGGGSSHNENGLKYFKKGFYEYAPHNKHQEANQYYEMAASEFKKAIAANEGDAAAHRNLRAFTTSSRNTPFPPRSTSGSPNSIRRTSMPTSTSRWPTLT